LAGVPDGAIEILPPTASPFADPIDSRQAGSQGLAVIPCARSLSGSGSPIPLPEHTPKPWLVRSRSVPYSIAIDNDPLPAPPVEYVLTSVSTPAFAVNSDTDPSKLFTT
jgi:hypothetical protein